MGVASPATDEGNSMEIRVIIAIVIALAIGFALTRKKKGQKPDVPLVWQAPVTPPTPITPTVPPTPVTPAPAAPPADPPLLDRNRKSPGDPGYDPRATRPDPEFSPIEPQGTFWGEGPFDPSARYIDLLGRFHNP